MKFQDRYSRIDRVLHRLAFATIEMQKGIADLEDRIYARHLAGIEIDRPVFITSLPRAGTTLLLEVLGSQDTFAAHTYRNMPFLLLPLLWNALSQRFHATDPVIARAHGDGMTVGYDSMEAFEEVLWCAFWPEKYREDRIVPWAAADTDAHGEFEQFIKTHMCKLITLRRNGESNPKRYISKNNGNIARIPTLLRLFPDGVVLVPFRNPVDHVGSMLRQHLNFEKLHGEEAFARRYMADTGHYDFGANLRPIDFGQWLEREDVPSPHSAEFWLKYWCAAFEHILSNVSDRVVFISYENCCANPVSALRHISDRIGLDADSVTARAARFREPNRYEVDALGIDQTLLNRARAIHAELLLESI